MSIHTPVLLKEVLRYLNPQPGQNFIDCTFGGGGHGLEILKRIQPGGKLLAIDVDKNIKTLKHENIKTKERNDIIFVNDNFRNLKEIVKKYFNYPVHGILLDLGMSSDQLEKPGGGFSFMRDEPLDMRFDVSQDLTAAWILNSYSLENLADIFKNYGEYHHTRRLAETIVKLRKDKEFETTHDLVAVVLQIHPRRFYEKIHPATKVFQALRIAVNDELDNLKKVLPQAIDVLVKSGRLVVVSFHGLEDKIVKNYLLSLVRLRPFSPKGHPILLDYGGQAPIKILTKKPIAPSDEEVKNNPRSRSAKMRVVEKL